MNPSISQLNYGNLALLFPTFESSDFAVGQKRFSPKFFFAHSVTFFSLYSKFFIGFSSKMQLCFNLSNVPFFSLTVFSKL